MNRIYGLLALAIAVLAGTAPALAANFVQDGAAMFSANTVQSLTAQIGAFNAQTGKEIVVITVPSLNGQTVENAAQGVFNEQQINGVMIFIAKDDRKDIVVTDQRTALFFPQATNTSIRQSMESQFKDGDYDGGITTAVSGVLNVFNAHVNTAGAPAQSGYSYPVRAQQSVATRTNGVHFSMFMWIIIFVVGYLVLKSIFRAMSGPRYYGGGPGMGGPGGPGYGGGGGYYGGGGGGFWSGMLGGLGGAFLGNEIFGNHGGQVIDQSSGNMIAGGDQGGGNSGWGNDAGQADMGNSSSGDFSGGGFGGDSGGGFGGGDFGGGGGDSGGGW
jgi:uncharacterized membrane protein YgcG